MKSKEVIHARAVVKRFGLTPVLRGANLNVQRGTVCGLLGANGAGKSTFIRILLGLSCPNGGETSLLGIPSDSLRPIHFRRIGHVSESQEYPGRLTADALFRYCREIHENWDDAFCAELVEKFALPMRTRLDRCSRGQRMKILLVSAITFHPHLVLLDEPFAGIDPRQRRDMADILLRLVSSDESTILIASHELEEIGHLIDRVIILKHGTTLLDENTDDLVRRYRRVEVFLPQSADVPRISRLPGNWTHVKTQGSRMTFVDCRHDPDECRRRLTELFQGGIRFETQGMSLREIYLAAEAHPEEEIL